MYGALTYTIRMYVNMGVKRSVRTSRMQPTILDILQNCFQGRTLKRLCLLKSPIGEFKGSEIY